MALLKVDMRHSWGQVKIKMILPVVPGKWRVFMSDPVTIVPWQKKVNVFM